MLVALKLNVATLFPFDSKERYQKCLVLFTCMETLVVARMLSTFSMSFFITTAHCFASTWLALASLKALIHDD